MPVNISLTYSIDEKGIDNNIKLKNFKECKYKDRNIVRSKINKIIIERGSEVRLGKKS